MDTTLYSTPTKKPRARQEMADYLAKHDRHEIDHGRAMTYSVNVKIWGIKFRSQAVREAAVRLTDDPFRDSFTDPLDAFIDKYHREHLMWRFAGRSGGHVILMWHGYQAIDENPYSEMGDWHYSRWLNRVQSSVNQYMLERRKVLTELAGQFEAEGQPQWAAFIHRHLGWFTTVPARPYMLGDRAAWYPRNIDLMSQLEPNDWPSEYRPRLYQALTSLKVNHAPEVSLNPYALWPSDLLERRTNMIYDFDRAVDASCANFVHEAEWRMENEESEIEPDAM